MKSQEDFSIQITNFKNLYFKHSRVPSQQEGKYRLIVISIYLTPVTGSHDQTPITGSHKDENETSENSKYLNPEYEPELSQNLIISSFGQTNGKTLKNFIPMC